jgi:uncharacterized protein (DUF488 family)
MRELFTIGHSVHELDEFLKLLAMHRIDAIGDVRSSPFSARLQQFNREYLSKQLEQAKIKYVFLGEELGARRSEREVYEDGVARYDRIAKTHSFHTGLGRVMQGAARFRIALMCAEKDPLECHRTILVCRHLRDKLRIQHVLADGKIETHTEAESRLMREEKVPAIDLFKSAAELLESAYQQRGKKIAYHECAEETAVT